MNIATQDIEPQNIRDCHGENEKIAEVQDIGCGDDRAQEGEDQEEDLIVEGCAIAEEPAPATLTIIGP